MSLPCPLCGGAGWVLDCQPERMPRALELLPCLLPDCEVSGTPIAILGLSGTGLARMARNPIDGTVMSVSAP